MIYIMFGVMNAVQDRKEPQLRWNLNSMCRTTYLMFIPSFKSTSQNMWRPDDPPLPVFLATRGSRIAQLWRKSVEFKSLNKSESTKVYRVCHFWGHKMKKKKIIWPVLGSRVGQNITRAMKLKLDVSCSLRMYIPSLKLIEGKRVP